jgi:hypothetical protein
VLNALVKAEHQGRQPIPPPPPPRPGATPLPVLPDTPSRIHALESLDHRAARAFTGKSIANLFDANQTEAFPRIFTFVIELGSASMKATADPKRYPGSTPLPEDHLGFVRAIGFMEAKTKTAPELFGSTDPVRVKRPDYLELLYPMAQDEITALRNPDGTFKPNYADYVKSKTTGNLFFRIKNATVKSIDFNTPIGGNPRQEHIDKHTLTAASVFKRLTDQFRIRIAGAVRFVLSDWYHLNPQVIDGENGKKILVLKKVDSHTITVDLLTNAVGELQTSAAVPRPGTRMTDPAETQAFVKSSQGFLSALVELVKITKP